MAIGPKEQMAVQAELRNWAIAILLEVGSMNECKHHPGTYFFGDTDVQEAYKKANAEITANRIELPEGMSRKEFTDIVKDVYEDHQMDECFECEKFRGE